MYVIHLAKQPFKFSCSHFTILAADRAECLHGHNYQLRVSIRVKDTDPKLGLAFDFNDVKPMIRAFCDRLDERILLPKNSPYLKLKIQGDQVEARFGEKFYSFPQEDTLTLPLVNITSEELARHAAETLAKEMSALPYWTVLQVNVEETRGQSVSFRVQR
jgi:6-pyruvoyltetrahydropterin/6-carboxytetrahydropterin synthase